MGHVARTFWGKSIESISDIAGCCMPAGDKHGLAWCRIGISLWLGVIDLPDAHSEQNSVPHDAAEHGHNHTH